MDSRSASILTSAVEAIGGAPREGQQQMAQAVCDTLNGGPHLLVQAGTGTGKSLGYLAPALDYLARRPTSRIVVATATLALQAQLANADIPAAAAAAERVTKRTIRHAILKGRSNYACLLRTRGGVGGMEQDSLLDGEELAGALRSSGADETSVLGAEVVALREWVESQASAGAVGDRDDAPAHTAAAWAQVSVPVRECIGVSACAYGAECMVERSREVARDAQLIVTNHALLAIDAMHGGTAIPEHDALIIDEAHELVSRVTGAATHELSPQQVERVSRRCAPWLDSDIVDELADVADDLAGALEAAPLERIEDANTEVVDVLSAIREVARRGAAAMPTDDAEAKQATAALKEILDVATAMAAVKPSEVLWVSERERVGRWLVLAPLDVALLLRDKVFAARPSVLTSATLKLGGDFGAVAASVGLRPAERVELGSPGPERSDEDDEDDEGAAQADRPQPWAALDVGSPFDYRRQGILYVADGLPNPGRDGIGPEALAEVAELLWAADGRVLGLFASQRNAEAAARHCRAELPGQVVLCQGDAQLSELTKRFVVEPQTALFGTLSLWQGVDIPGDACLCVIIDKIPFPRPDEPLMQARQRAVAERGGNGFMSVAATHAALLLAQGSGRLIRRVTDRGVVAVLDPRLKRARYGSFLRASIPDFWQTSERDVAVEALRRLAESASR